MTVEVSHVVSRCARCSGLTKAPMSEFIGHIIASYMKARISDCSEIVIQCDACRRKQHGEEPDDPEDAPAG